MTKIVQIAPVRSGHPEDSYTVVYALDDSGVIWKRDIDYSKHQQMSWKEVEGPKLHRRSTELKYKVATE